MSVMRGQVSLPSAAIVALLKEIFNLNEAFPGKINLNKGTQTADSFHSLQTYFNLNLLSFIYIYNIFLESYTAVQLF